jgi:DNA/RNA endonuclease YhcR with UshA esterase domain
MRCFALALAAASLIAPADLQAAKPLTSAEAAKKIDEKVTVEMEVKSTGGNTACYLNSEADFRAASNFTIFIPQAALAKFIAASIENPREHFKGKLVQVTGTVALYRDKPQIRVDEPAQIKVIEKK